jgi:hypothetical protein
MQTIAIYFEIFELERYQINPTIWCCNKMISYLNIKVKFYILNGNTIKYIVDKREYKNCYINIYEKDK